MYDMYNATAYGLMKGFLAAYGMIGLVIAVATIVAMWKLFQKAGKPGWAAIVPFYNTYCLFDISFGNGWMFLLCLIPCVNFVIYIILCLKLAKSFGQGTGFGIGLIFLNVIFILILGFGNYQYMGPAGSQSGNSY